LLAVVKKAGYRAVNLCYASGGLRSRRKGHPSYAVHVAGNVDFFVLLECFICRAELVHLAV